MIFIPNCNTVVQAIPSSKTIAVSPKGYVWTGGYYIPYDVKGITYLRSLEREEYESEGSLD